MTDREYVLACIDPPRSSKNCARCDRPATFVKKGHHLCALHLRFIRMRESAKNRGKVVPSTRQLETLFRKDMRCGDCNNVMAMTRKEDAARVMTLQHYRDGTFGLVCQTCNTQHAFMPGDTFCDLPPKHKLCPDCSRVLPLTSFWADCYPRRRTKKATYCKPCATKRLQTWRENNRERSNAYHRAYRPKWKAMKRLAAAKQSHS